MFRVRNLVMHKGSPAVAMGVRRRVRAQTREGSAVGLVGLCH